MTLTLEMDVICDCEGFAFLGVVSKVAMEGEEIEFAVCMNCGETTKDLAHEI